MKITGTRTVEVEISTEETLRIALSAICQAFNWKRTYRIQDGKVVEPRAYRTSHVWEEECSIREASEEDRAVELIISRLNKGL